MWIKITNVLVILSIAASTGDSLPVEDCCQNEMCPFDCIRCDGKTQCYDLSDELGCDNKTDKMLNSFQKPQVFVPLVLNVLKRQIRKEKLEKVISHPNRICFKQDIPRTARLTQDPPTWLLLLNKLKSESAITTTTEAPVWLQLLRKLQTETKLPIPMTATPSTRILASTRAPIQIPITTVTASSTLTPTAATTPTSTTTQSPPSTTASKTTKRAFYPLQTTPQPVNWWDLTIMPPLFQQPSYPIWTPTRVPAWQNVDSTWTRQELSVSPSESTLLPKSPVESLPSSSETNNITEILGKLTTAPDKTETNNTTEALSTTPGKTTPSETTTQLSSTEKTLYSVTKSMPVSPVLVEIITKQATDSRNQIYDMTPIERNATLQTTQKATFDTNVTYLTQTATKIINNNNGKGNVPVQTTLQMINNNNGMETTLKIINNKNVMESVPVQTTPKITNNYNGVENVPVQTTPKTINNNNKVENVPVQTPPKIMNSNIGMENVHVQATPKTTQMNFVTDLPWWQQTTPSFDINNLWDQTTASSVTPSWWSQTTHSVFWNPLFGLMQTLSPLNSRSALNTGVARPNYSNNSFSKPADSLSKNNQKGTIPYTSLQTPFTGIAIREVLSPSTNAESITTTGTGTRDREERRQSQQFVTTPSPLPAVTIGSRQTAQDAKDAPQQYVSTAISSTPIPDNVIYTVGKKTRNSEPGQITNKVTETKDTRNSMLLPQDKVVTTYTVKQNYDWWNQPFKPTTWFPFVNNALDYPTSTYAPLNQGLPMKKLMSIGHVSKRWQSEPVTATASPSTTTSKPTTPENNGDMKDCVQIRNIDFCQHRFSGHYKNPLDCRTYYVCNWGQLFKCHCPQNTLFDTKINVCNWDYAVEC